MGLFQAKNRVIQAAAALLALFAVPAYPQQNTSAASTTVRAPASRSNQEARPPTEGTAMAQADAFTTAGEQASFLGAYQMYFGPYGKATNDDDRNKMIRETAAAIDDCINQRDCGADKQEKVLKALMQYNMGQDVKRMMLTNSTNKEAMRSIDNSGDPSVRAKGQGVLNQSEIEQALSRGKDFSVDKSDPIKPYQSGKVTTIGRSTGSTKDPYYQLDEAEVTHKIDSTYLREREILGDKFLKDYSAFIDDFSAADDRISRRFYKYVPTKADGKVYVYEGRGSVINCYKDANGCQENGSLTVNQDRMAAVQGDQQNKKVRELVADYRKNLTAMQGYRGDDGEVHVIKDGSHPSDLGFGEMVEIDPARFPNVNFNDLMENGKIKPELRSRAIARVVNQEFARTAADAEKERSKNRDIASSSNQQNPNWIHNITLSPESFDQFLDDIWPSSAGRKEILSRIPAQTAEEPAVEPETTNDRRDTRPTDNRPRPVNTKYYQGNENE